MYDVQHNDNDLRIPTHATNDSEQKTSSVGRLTNTTNFIVKINSPTY